jgi:hypothetical protein
MDVESKSTLDEALSRAQQAGDEMVTRVTTQMSGIVAATIDKAKAAAEEVADRAMGDMLAAVTSLDGWTVSIAFPQSPIVIKLNAPKKAS